MKNLVEIEDFIENPTEISKHLIEIIIRVKKKYDTLLTSKNPIKKIINNVRIRLWYLNKYIDIYNFIHGYKHYQIKKNKPLKNIENLFKEFEKIYNTISLNNLLLMYAFLTQGDRSGSIIGSEGEMKACFHFNRANQFQAPLIINKEDEKLLCFKKLYDGEISCEEFKRKYGHYGLNAFELSSRRFNEYSQFELMNLAKYLKDFRPTKNIKLDKYIKTKHKNLFAVYSALREELRYCALFIINDLRFELLKLAKKKKIKNIFNLNWYEIKRQVIS